ncbi:4Fe-4S dicluster domain-containing protein [Roseococcus sp. DSY-14]|uniref:4Fe-4S dicluster domain-containing protein n=1 Tax=Roseococcus sp. DSY-14 TaxID=3369650 RepID=UPI00387A9D70
MSGGPTRRDAFAAPWVLAALAGCDGPDEFGQPLHGRGRGTAFADASWATILDLDGLARGVLVRTRDGHPIKVEGNPRHPASLGASDVFLESAPLSLHDPARSRRALRLGRPAAPEDAFAALRGPGLRILTGPVASPTQERLLAEALAAFPGAAWHVHDPMADPAAAAGALAAFGQPAEALPDLRRAGAVLCLGADPLGPGPAQLALARAWAEARPRLVVAEATPSLTGARAALRLAIPPAEAEALARTVAARLGLPGLAMEAAHPAAEAVAAALRGAGPVAVLAGRGAPPAVHAIAHALGHHLGGGAMRWIAPPLATARPAEELLEALRAGAVERLLVLDADPAFDLAGFAAALRARPVAAAVHVGPRLGATARLCPWHVPLAHPLEQWGDGRAFDGTPALRQPVARPAAPDLHGPVRALLALLGRAEEGERAAVQATWRAAWGEDGFEARWEAALEDGVAGPAAPPLDGLAPRAGWDRPSPAAAPGWTALFAPDPHLRAGAFAQEAWLQELPRPLTRLSWGNAALLAPEDAARLGLAAGDEVELALGGAAARAPVLPLAGQAPGCVTLPLGFGQAGPVAEAARGFDAQRLRPPGAWAVEGLALRPTGRRAPLLVAEGARPLAGEPALRVLAPGAALPPIGPQASLHPPWPYPAQAWGMAVDLDACIGCNACAAACQAENNVPPVGPEAMAAGRGLHWLRVDRHARPGGAAAFQPVPCMQCEQAPCEPVCPVNATVHDHEGLNAMVPARCIGTRTCANNCPYGVRRFNWEERALPRPARNPEVAARPRGVMEKCTYCSHRIAAARADGRLAEVQTACQRACPTGAILFGDLNDPASPVSAARRAPRAYLLLEALGTRPRTSYLARVEDGGAAG